MPNLFNTDDNRHPLSGDFRMYYRGTNVCRQDPKTGELLVMYVRDVQGRGDERSLDLIDFIGDVFNAKGQYVNGDGNHEIWNGDTVDFRPPLLGYRMVGKNPVFFSQNPPNRSQKKGFNTEGLRASIGVTINRQVIHSIFADKQFDGRLSRELVLNQGSVLWAGSKIGTFADGILTIKKAHLAVKEFVCKLLERSSEVKSVQTEE